jgi:hypothetical protein
VSNNRLISNSNETKILKANLDVEIKIKKNSKTDDVCAASVCHVPMGKYINSFLLCCIKLNLFVILR